MVTTGMISDESPRGSQMNSDCTDARSACQKPPPNRKKKKPSMISARQITT